MAEQTSPKQIRRGAERVVQQLRSASFEAFLVGGCVRDKLLGKTPKEFDIATSATPEEVMALFKRTVAIGAQFGVVMVLVPEGEYEVATFRMEASYSDGRRPDGVTFASAKEDVLRRDFTINGLLEDPESGVIEDFVNGRADLEAGVIRAIGDPNQRFNEDHLRMLRAIRFAATLEFDIEVGTFMALTQNAEKVVTVSGERVRSELERMFSEGDAVRAFTLLSSTKVRHALFPESAKLSTKEATQVIESLTSQDLPTIIAVFLASATVTVGDSVSGRLKFSNTEKKHLLYLLETRSEFDVDRSYADKLRFIRHNLWPVAAQLVRAELVAAGHPAEHIDNLIALRESLSADHLNPPALLSGNDLIGMGLKPGPHFKTLLTALESEQLEGRIVTREEAEQFVLKESRP